MASPDGSPPALLSLFLGTKAQLIKMAPIALELERRGWQYQLIDTGQHAELVRHIAKDFELAAPCRRLIPSGAGVATLAAGAWWLLRLLRLLFLSRRSLRGRLFDGRDGLCLVHGDTASTLLSTLIARRAGQRVAHVEAGLRSHRLLDPFPEELIRVLVMRLAHVCFAPSQTAYDNLVAMGLGDRAVLLPGNTNLDTLRSSLRRRPNTLPEVPEQYCLATIHRIETLYRRRRLATVVEILLDVHRRVPLVFIQHPPTQRRLVSGGLMPRLEEAGIMSLPLVDHPTFVHLLQRASLVITDGGSVQEETSYLGIPCLLLRESTEREDGLAANVVLSRINRMIVSDYLEHFAAYRKASTVSAAVSPSEYLVDQLPSILRSSV